MTKNLVLFHGGCIDGFTSAWVAYQQFGDNAEYKPVYHYEDPPSVADRDVYIIDFCYFPETLEKMRHEASSIKVLDHHESALERMLEYMGEGEELSNYRRWDRPWLSVVFDMEQSGAGMAWEFFCPGEESPWLVKYVEDRDLWRFALESSEVINALVSATPQTFDDWDRLSELSVHEAYELGTVAHMTKRQYIEAAKKQAMRVRFLEYSNIPCTNVLYWGCSEVVGELAENEAFALGWFQRPDGKYQYSLRSRGEGSENVAKIARRFDGGGHASSAGFVTSHPVHIFE